MYSIGVPRNRVSHCNVWRVQFEFNDKSLNDSERKQMSAYIKLYFNMSFLIFLITWFILLQITIVKYDDRVI